MTKIMKRVYQETKQIFSIKHLGIAYGLLGNIELLRSDEKIDLDEIFEEIECMENV